MTPEFGAAVQLEKIDMLDFADVVAINKFERRGAEDARRDVARQVLRNREAFGASPEDMPVFGTIAARFNDDGVTALYQHLRDRLAGHGLAVHGRRAGEPSTRRCRPGRTRSCRRPRARYLAEIADDGARLPRGHRPTEVQAGRADARGRRDGSSSGRSTRRRRDVGDSAPWSRQCDRCAVDADDDRLLAGAPGSCRGAERPGPAGPGVAVGHLGPQARAARTADDGDLLALAARGEPARAASRSPPGCSPSSATDEDPARMFAGEGDPARTNRRFHLLAEGQPATRLSTAFDSVTLYGCDPAERPDIYGKVGNSGVSIATLDDMKVLYDGFDLCDPTTSVSMTINGPAPAILAMFLNTAIDQRSSVPRRARARARRAGAGGLRPGSCRTCAAPCRPTSSRRTRARTPASSPPSSPSR